MWGVGARTLRCIHRIRRATLRIVFSGSSAAIRAYRSRELMLSPENLLRFSSRDRCSSGLQSGDTVLDKATRMASCRRLMRLLFRGEDIVAVSCTDWDPCSPKCEANSLYK